MAVSRQISIEGRQRGRIVPGARLAWAAGPTWRENAGSGARQGRIGVIYRTWLQDEPILDHFEPLAGIAFAGGIWHRSAVAGTPWSPPTFLTDAGVAQW